MAWRWPTRWAQALLAATLWLGCARGVLPPPEHPTLAPPLASVDVISVGRADAILVRSAAGKRMLIDGGEAASAPAVLAVLRQQSACPLDLILLTHPHADHAGGLPRIVEDCGAPRLMDSGYPHPSRVYARLLETLERRGVALSRAEPGLEIDLGAGTTLTLLGPPQPFLRQGDDLVNANSVVARLTAGRVSVLFAADANLAGEAWLLGRGLPLRSTVLKVGHHGSRTSSTVDFLAAVAPRLAIISNGGDSAKHPHPETLARLAAVRARVVETGRAGTVHLELGEDGISWSSQTGRGEVLPP